MLEFLELEKATEYAESLIKQEGTVVLSDESDDSGNQYCREIFYQRWQGFGKILGKLYLSQIDFNGKNKFFVSRHEFFDFEVAKFKEWGCLSDLL